MKLPRDLSGQALAAQLIKHWHYTRVHQRGSHIVLETHTPHHHRIARPDHQPLRIGTLSAILKAVAEHQGVGKAELLSKR